MRHLGHINCPYKNFSDGSLTPTDRIIIVGMEPRRPAIHHTIMIVDVEGFGDRQRTNAHQVSVRAALYKILQRAFLAANISWTACQHEDRGDGVLVLVPAVGPKTPFVDTVPLALVAALREHNQRHPVEEQIRLRMALHAGEVQFDQHGVTSASVNLTFRLIDARPIKTALADSPGVLALITSGWFFEDVIRHSKAAHPATFRAVRVTNKETSTVAWIALPDHPYPSDPSALTSPPPEPVAGPVPHQLPAAPRLFTGRHDELTALTAALNTTTGAGTPVVITTVTGAGGMGKTWLALHWAHQYLDRFPDGHLFVDLQGFSPASDPMPPAAAVRGFLDALGVDPNRLPADLHAQAALYRSLVAGKRMLILLDNAVDVEQVVPLLPGSASCTVLVTSRRHLTSLIARHGAHQLCVGVLTDIEARQLLTSRLGADRVATEPHAFTDLLACCAGHPLALSIVAGRAGTVPDMPLADLAADLRDSTSRLDVLDDDDPAASLPAVLSWSLRGLTTLQRTVFGLLGIAPGPDITLPAVASLTGERPTRAKRLLRALEEASLLDRDAHDRYSMHDLIRADAAITAHDMDNNARTAALGRILDFYTHTAHAANHLLQPHRLHIQLDPPAPGAHSHPQPDYPAAMAWFEAEHPNLLAAQRIAISHHRHRTVWHLAWTLNPYLVRRGHRHDRLAVWQAALDATTNLPDPTLRVSAHRILGRAYADLGHHEQAITHMHHALTLAEHHHNPTQQANTHRALAWAWELRGDDQRALDHATQALHLCRTLDQPVWEASALNAVGWYATRLGDHDSARTHCQAALTLHRRHHNSTGEANTLYSLGNIDHHTGHHHRAIDHYQHALILRRQLGHTTGIANILDNLGHSHVALGQHDRARTVWREALQLYQEQGRDADAVRVQQQLDDLDKRSGRHL
jgi:tetratricopeptide (TPR) repeat protein